MAQLFDPFELKGLHLRNRIGMSPMNQYCAQPWDGVPTEWHYVHYVTRAIGGVGLIVMEQTNVLPEGCITINDLGLWNERQVEGFRRIIDAVHEHGARIGIQIAHAGRKAEHETLACVGPSAIAFSPEYRVPESLSRDEIQRIVEAFGQAARRAIRAGVDFLELHGAHGYLVHQFMSPLSNRRDDEYGDPRRFPLEVIAAVRAVLPRSMPLFMRVSASEWTPEGYRFPEFLAMCRAFRDAGIDLFDVTSGGNSPARPPREDPGYQVPFAAQLRQELSVPVAAVGKLDDPSLAQKIVETEQADIVLIGRGLMRQPYFPNAASVALRNVRLVPTQYHRAFPGTAAPPGDGA